MARTNGSKRLKRGKARWEKKRGKRSPSVPPISSQRPSRPRLRPRLDSEPRLARAPETRVERASAPKLERGSMQVDGLSAPRSTNTTALELDFELTFEHDFFLADLPPRSEEPLEPLEVEEEDPEFRVLTAAELARRLWFRRQVARVVAFLAAFVLLALLLRLSAAGQ